MNNNRKLRKIISIRKLSRYRYTITRLFNVNINDKE